MTDARNGRWSASEADSGNTALAAATHAYPARGCSRDARPTGAGNVANSPPMYSAAAAAAHRAVGDEHLSSPQGCTTLDSRRKKLSKSKLMLPLSRERRSSGDLSSVVSTNGLKLMSPADERMIDEAIELANQFARTSLQSQEQDGDPGACTKSRNKFLLKFPLKKTSPQVEKKSFTDGLAMKATAAVAQLLTPESEAAYYELVAKGSSPSPSGSVSTPLSATAGGSSGSGRAAAQSRLPCARSVSLMGSDHQGSAAPQLPVDVPSTAFKARILRRSSSPAMTTFDCQQQHTLQAQHPQPPDGQVPGSARHQSAPRPVLRKSMSAATDQRPSLHQSWSSTKVRPRHLAIVCDYGGLSDEADVDEGIMADDLSDLPSSPPPPVPLAPSSSAYVGIGLYNNLDPFWRHEMRLDFEADEEITSMQGRYKTRSEDNVSYEELLEFAPVVTEHDRDVIRVMQKVLGREVTENDCHRALRETHGDALNAIKFVKLMQLWRRLQADGFNGASVAQCKEALMYCNWDVGWAARHVTMNSGPSGAGATTTAARRGAASGVSAAAPRASEPPRPAAHRALSCPLAWSGT